MSVLAVLHPLVLLRLYLFAVIRCVDQDVCNTRDKSTDLKVDRPISIVKQLCDNYKCDCICRTI